VQGVVRIFDPISGEGIVVNEADRGDLAVAPTALEGSLFQTLRQGQRINFELDADGRAINVRLGSEVDMGLPTAQV
jgi:cold shock CspA family protein